MADDRSAGETLDDTQDTRADLGVAETVAGHRGAGATAPSVPIAIDLIGAMAGEYLVERKLGEGGMGTVYGARHPVIGKRAAIKVIKKEMCARADLVERFVQEARAVNRIGHPNIVDVFAFGTLPDGRDFLVMEWLRGESLAQRMKRGRLPFGEAIAILDGVTRGLEAAHAERIIHRDLKPDNVFLVEVRGERPLIKLLDFGIAKLIGGEDAQVELTRSGAFIGTPRYISPEQARGLVIDFRADVYSLGVMAFEMFTGVPPFVAATAMDVVAMHLNEPPPRARTLAPVPVALDRLLARMLEKEAADRPDLAQVRAALEDLRSASVDVALAGTVPEAQLPAALQATRRRRRVGALIAGGVVAVAAAAGGVMYAGRGDGPAGSAASGTSSAPAKVEAPAPVAPTAAAPTAAAPTAAAPPASVPTPIAPAPTPATGHLTLRVSGGTPARITIDGNAIEHPGAITELDLPPGTHPVVVSARGRRAASLTVQVNAGAITDVTLPLGAAVGHAGATTTSSPRPGSDDADDAPVNPFTPRSK